MTLLKKDVLGVESYARVIFGDTIVNPENKEKVSQEIVQ